MWAVRFGVLAALIAVMVGAGAAQAQVQPDAGPIVVRSGEVVELDGQSKEMAFVSGGRVRITAQVADDIFAAGRILSVEGARAEHLFLAGRELDVAPATVRDLIAAGGHLRLRSGAVDDDVVAAGGEIELDREARIAGSTVLAGGRVRIEAPIGRELIARGRRVELNGPVGGDVRIRADEVVIGPQARIGGDLYVRGASIEISPAAVVQGRTSREAVRRDDHGAAEIGLAAALFALGVLVMNAAVAAAAPRFVENLYRRLRARFWPTVGVGALIMILGPLVIFVLLATVLGGPLGLLLLLAYLLAVPLAFIGVSYSIGRFIRNRTGRRRAEETPGLPARIGWTALAALILMVVCSIPILGWLVWLFTLASGMGALAAHVLLRAAPESA